MGVERRRCRRCNVVRSRSSSRSNKMLFTFPSGRVRECNARGPVMPPACEVAF